MMKNFYKYRIQMFWMAKLKRKPLICQKIKGKTIKKENHNN
jgi:hypothetical protein